MNIYFMCKTNYIYFLLRRCLQSIYKSRQDSHAAAKAKEDAEKIMTKLDTDHNKKLTEAEFIHAAKSCPAILHILQGQ